MSSLAMRETELDKVVPKNQPMFAQKNYVGIFQFRFVETLKNTSGIVAEKCNTVCTA
jgi:hypothetical protein